MRKLFVLLLALLAGCRDKEEISVKAVVPTVIDKLVLGGDMNANRHAITNLSSLSFTGAVPWSTGTFATNALIAQSATNALHADGATVAGSLSNSTVYIPSLNGHGTNIVLEGNATTNTGHMFIMSNTAFGISTPFHRVGIGGTLGISGRMYGSTNGNGGGWLDLANSQLGNAAADGGIAWMDGTWYTYRHNITLAPYGSYGEWGGTNYLWGRTEISNSLAVFGRTTITAQQAVGRHSFLVNTGTNITAGTGFGSDFLGFAFTNSVGPILEGGQDYWTGNQQAIRVGGSLTLSGNTIMQQTPIPTVIMPRSWLSILAVDGISHAVFGPLGSATGPMSLSINYPSISPGTNELSVRGDAWVSGNVSASNVFCETLGATVTNKSDRIAGLFSSASSNTPVLVVTNTGSPVAGQTLVAVGSQGTNIFAIRDNGQTTMGDIAPYGASRLTLKGAGAGGGIYIDGGSGETISIYPRAITWGGAGELITSYGMSFYFWGSGLNVNDLWYFEDYGLMHPLNKASGTQTVVRIQGTINQGGTATAVALMVNPAVSGLGSGGGYLLWLGTNSNPVIMATMHGDVTATSLKTANAITGSTFVATSGPHWTPYVNAAAPTVTVYIANGDLQALSCTGAVVIASDSSYTNDVASIRLDLWAGTNAVTWTTNTISGTEDLDISTNSCTTVLLDRQWSNAVWRARQL